MFGEQNRRGAPGRALGLGFVLLFLLGGCGYHLAGHGPSDHGVIPASARVIAVLPFTNQTRQPRLSQTISAAVAQELIERTHARVQPTAAGSDVAVHGDLLSVETNPVTFDAHTGRASTVEIVLHLRAWVTSEPDGKVVYRNDDLVFHDQYMIATEQQNFVEEDSVAFQRLSHAIAQSLVSDILEAF